jgi:NTP pyrophosphatase (non-canonical NTP hydrolase)
MQPNDNEQKREVKTKPEEIHRFLIEGAQADEYQAIARKTATFPDQGGPLGLFYCGLKLNGEAGEVAELLGKAIRDDLFGVDKEEISDERKIKIIRELGDVMWYIAMIADQLNVPLAIVMEMNLAKLHNRAVKGTLHGEGSDR